MAVTVNRIDLGFDQCYLLKAEGAVLVDAGGPNRRKEFIGGLKKAAIEAHEVKLVVITHGHWDHIGSAGEIRSITGAKLAMHYRDAVWLEGSQKHLSPGVSPWGKLFNKIHWLFMPFITISPTKVDVLLGDEGLPLADYGIPGKIYYTPGHTAGSVSVLLDTGEAFVGDLAMSRFPLRLSPGLPIFADDLRAVSASWKLLLAHGATTVYPAHGRPFPAEIIKRALW